MAEDLQNNTSQQEQLEPQASSNKRIAKNALMLYIRMFLTMVVGLYTSRVVLSTLGVEDYGTYGVVGGVVAMLGFLNASMSGATSRFLAFELGRDDKKRLADTFSSAMIVHIGIAIIVFILAETIGLWFLCNKLVIPEGRMEAAHWVYQCSILSAMLSITQAPYNATIIAHEKMGIYAYVEILHVSLKLLIVYLLVIGNFDKLKFYAVLVLLVTLLTMLVYRLYCIRKFHETRLHWIWNKEILKPLLRFSGWNLYGSLCVTIRQQGTNFLINIFFGVAYNAAATVATTLQGIIKAFTFNTTVAFRPQIIKNYANGNYEEMLLLIKSSFSMAIFLTLLISVPLFAETNYLMCFWLKNPPHMSTVFARLLMISALFAMMTLIFTIGIEATGYNKKVNVFTGTIYMLTIPTMYIFFYYNFGVEYSYYCIVGANILIFMSNMIIFKHLVPSLKILDYLKIIAKTCLIISIIFIPIFFINNKMSESIIRLIYNTLISETLLIILSYSFLLDKRSKIAIRKKITNIFKK